MLLSQRAAHKSAFIHFPYRTLAAGSRAFSIRMKILRAVKYVVGTDVWDRSSNYDEMLGRIYGDEKLNKAKAISRAKLYGYHCKMPHPVFFVENESGGILFEQEEGTRWICTWIDNRGGIEEAALRFHVNPYSFRVSSQAVWLIDGPVKKPLLGFNKQEEVAAGVNELHKFLTLMTMEIFVLLNHDEITKAVYLPDPFENIMVEDKYHPFYSYRTFVPSYENKRFNSLTTLMHDAGGPTSLGDFRKTHHAVVGYFNAYNTYIKPKIRRNPQRQFETEPFVRTTQQAAPVTQAPVTVVDRPESIVIHDESPPVPLSDVIYMRQRPPIRIKLELKKRNK